MVWTADRVVDDGDAGAELSDVSGEKRPIAQLGNAEEEQVDETSSSTSKRTFRPTNAMQCGHGFVHQAGAQQLFGAA